MYISRGILLSLIVIFTFSPAILNWITHTPAAWHRPFIAWFGLIILAFLAHHLHHGKDNHV